MTKYCGYCRQPYTNNNKTYCSLACSQKAYELMKQDGHTWQKLRGHAKELAEFDQEIQIEAAIEKWESNTADILTRRLRELLNSTAKEVVIGSGDHLIERLADGRYATHVYHMEGEWEYLVHDSLEDACRALSDEGWWDLYGLGDPEDVSLEDMS